MVWMLLCILSGAAFGHIMRHAQVRQRHLAWVGAWNYLFAGLAAWVWLGLQPSAGLNGPAAVLGTLCGASYAAAFFALDHAIRAAGVGVTLSVQWLGVSLPVAASILFWGEIPRLMQALGLGMAALSLPLLACGSSAADAPRGRWRVAFLLGLFILEGLVGLTMKIYSQRVATGSELPFLCFMFSGAAAGSILAALRLARPRRQDLPHGICMGASNILCNFTFLRALALLSGTVVFPTISAGSVAVTAVLGWLLWGERYQGRTLAGLVLAALALVAINA